MIEGGDILVIDEHVLLIGKRITDQHRRDRLPGKRSIAGLVRGRKHVIVQQLPHSPESFIHLDMVFTIVGLATGDGLQASLFKNKRSSPTKPWHIEIEGRQGRQRISSVSSILNALRNVRYRCEPIVWRG